MNFEMERKEKAEKIEAVIAEYLPREEGYQKRVGDELQHSRRREEAAADAVEGNF